MSWSAQPRRLRGESRVPARPAAPGPRPDRLEDALAVRDVRIIYILVVPN
jgi:hypothetical protein